ncbi:hypothetical protein Clacol_001142 [Clathrus columnatus]|uniref:Uncharacterized protein n=1 Tax=Clathrus columnatus TaxID=1419009 RepID=A0AAV4ZXP9_9AGAM|nr:hypothetical protein Clacol_001142 [Clathrus columnatus]
MTDNLTLSPASLDNLADQYDEQTSATLLVTSKGPRKALRLLVPTLAKMFIDNSLIGKALSGTLYYNSSKELEGDNSQYFVQEVLKNGKYRVYVFFFKPPRHPEPSDPTDPTDPPENLNPSASVPIPLPLPYATFMAPDLRRHINAHQLHQFRGTGKWTDFYWGSSVAKVTNILPAPIPIPSDPPSDPPSDIKSPVPLPPSNSITISIPAIHITGKLIHTEPHLQHILPPFVAAQGIIYHKDYQSLETTKRALYSPDSIVFYAKDAEEADQLAFRLVNLPCLMNTAGSLTLSGRIKR